MQGRQQHLGVGLRRKFLALPSQFIAQFQVIVELAVVDDAAEASPIAIGWLPACVKSMIANL